jgi:hypothetical protein
MESDVFLPCSQETTTGTYPEPKQIPLTPISSIYIVISFHLRLRLPRGIFPSLQRNPS